MTQGSKEIEQILSLKDVTFVNKLNKKILKERTFYHLLRKRDLSTCVIKYINIVYFSSEQFKQKISFIN